MHDDPTRMMGQPEQPGRPGDGRPHGNMRLLVAGLIAVIVGLAIAIVVIADGNGGESASTVTKVLPSETTATESTSTTSESTSTEPTTSEEEGGETTTTEPTTAPEEEAEESGSGGIPAE